MNYLADPGGRFSSDTHRRVLGHLSYPDDTYGWSVEALFNRMVPDVGTKITSLEELSDVLEELQGEGYASDNGMGVWRMTQHGFDILTGEANVPSEGPVRPAMIGVTGATELSSEPTDLGSEDAANSPS